MIAHWLRKKFTPPSIIPIISEIDRRGLYMDVYRNTYDGAYTATIKTVAIHGVECKVTGKGPTFDAALADAWQKWP